MTTFQYTLFWWIMFIVAGGILYVFDMRIGTKIYRWYYNATHRRPLHQEAHRGFLYKRNFKARFWSAFAISLFQSALAIGYWQTNPLWEFMGWFLEIPMLIGGFYAGPFFDHLWARRKEYFASADRLEAEHSNLKEKIITATSNSWSWIREVLKERELPQSADIADGKKEIGPSVTEPFKTELEKQPEEDPRETIRRYTQRGGS